MPIKITKLVVKDQINKKTRKPVKRPIFFCLDLEFEIKLDSSDCWNDYNYLLEELLEWHEIIILRGTPQQYEEAAEKRRKKYKNDFVKMVNSGPNPYKKAWAPGIDMLTVLKKKGKVTKYKFSNYFTYSPTTRAILFELKKLQKDPSYSFKTIPEQYFAHLIKSLSMFWD